MSDAFPTPPPAAVMEAALTLSTWAKTQTTSPWWELAGLTTAARARHLEEKLALTDAKLRECSNYSEIAHDAYRQEKTHREMLEALLASAKTRIKKLEGELEAHAWTISPAMAQEKIDQLNERAEAAETGLREIRRAAVALKRDTDTHSMHPGKLVESTTSAYRSLIDTVERHTKEEAA